MEQQSPGIVARTAHGLADAGASPTRAAVKRAIAGEGNGEDSGVAAAGSRIRVPPGATPESECRRAMALEAGGAATKTAAAAIGWDQMIYSRGRYIVELSDNPRLSAADAAQIRETYGETPGEAAAKRDRALATLFRHSGWTQQELAKVEGKSEGWISRQLRFSRFLQFLPDGNSPENPLFSKLTERRFRGYWARTDTAETNERIRFQAVVKLIEESRLLAPGSASAASA